jgi:signal transduction histidine kinase/ligand-binding sensor domain-containing protein
MSLKPLFIIYISFIFSGCWLSSRQIPLLVNESEFSKPLVKPFKLSAPRKVKWNVVPADSIHPGHFYPFDVSKLPSKPFNPGGFNPLPKPATVKDFHYNALPDTAFDLNAIPSEPLVGKTSLIGVLKKTVLAMPKIRTDSYFTSFQYSDEQGFPSKNILSILHNRNGLLWIATREGLCIVNGESMEIFPTNYGTVLSMSEDQKGQVWLISQENGVYVINRKAGIQIQYAFPFGTFLQIDRNGFIWVPNFGNGIFLISPDQKSFKHLTNKNGLRNNNCVRTMEDRDGRIWLSNSRNGIDILDLAAKKIKRLGPEQGLANTDVIGITENRAGDICIGGNTHHGIEIINIRNNTIKHLDSAQGIKKTNVFNMLEDDEDHMWIASDTGVYILSKNADSIIHIGSREGLVDDFVFALEKDDQHQIYVGTFNTVSGGFYIFPQSSRVAHHISKEDGMLSNDVWALFNDSKQRLWIGSYSGVNIITPDHKISKLLANPAGNNRTDAIIQTGPDQFILAGIGNGLNLIDDSKHTIEIIGMKEGLPDNRIEDLYQDRRGMIWIGTQNSGVFLFDPQKRTIRTLNKNSGLSNNEVKGVIEDSSGKFWIATIGGLDILDLTENTIRSYTTKEGLSYDDVAALLKDKKNRFWLATERGLNFLDPLKETNTIFSLSNGIPSNGIYSLMEKEGVIYAGTGKGLTVIKEEEKTFSGSNESSWNLQTYGKPQGFGYIDFNEYAAAIDHNGQFWWGITPGVTMMNKSVIQPDSSISPPGVTGIDILGKSQYFIDPDLYKNADTVWSDNKDTFYLKGTFNTLNTDRQKDILWDSLSSIYLPVNLSLPPVLNYLRFHFSNLLPQNAGDYKYCYILDGVDEKWSSITAQPFSDNYNNISPGYYTFRVAAKKGLGPWSEPSVYHFRIRPPWWYSWWAELIYLLLFIGLVRLWVTYRSRRLLKENARLEEKITERTTALTTSLENLRQTQAQLIQAEKMASLGELTAGIAHEIQNPLNFVNNFSEVNTELLGDVNTAMEQGNIPEARDFLKDLELNMEKITIHGKRADAIVKGMLLHSRASSGQKMPTDVNALADEYLRLSYHGLRAKDKSFNAQFEMNFDKNITEVMLVQQDIGRVLLNLFNNAFYSVTQKRKQLPENYQPTVSVTTKKNKDTIEIRVRDNGQGISKKIIDKIYQPFFTTKPAGQGTGLGLSLSYDIITKEHSGKINVVTKENEFTEFIIELPAEPVV